MASIPIPVTRMIREIKSIADSLQNLRSMRSCDANSTSRTLASGE